MKSPFKFLDAFTLSDKNSFFGREREIEMLYEMVFKSPLSLIYGLSGTGKTSLIQCGLAGKFDGPDWFPLFIRRQGDYRNSIRDIMEHTTQGQYANLVDAVRYLFSYHLRPVYLVFDQFEEIFTAEPSVEEQKFFQEEIQSLIEAELPCKIIIVMREEYIAQLYEMERYIPTIFDYRLRVEPMNTLRVKEVMRASFQKFNITLEGDQETMLQLMTDNISGGSSIIQLPYLQVYLDMLYREDIARTYGNKKIETNLPHIEFTSEEIADFGEIDDVLEKFLEEQVSNLQMELEAGEYADQIPAHAVRKVLDAFVTDDGTKRPVYYEKDAFITLADEVGSLLSNIPTKPLTWILESLENSRILRFSKEYIELAHDSLAAKVDEQRTDEQRQLNEIQRRLKNNYAEYVQTGEYLSRKQLTAYEEYIPRLALEERVLNYVKHSSAHTDRLERKLRFRRSISIA